MLRNYSGKRKLELEKTNLHRRDTSGYSLFRPHAETETEPSLIPI
jgi:hypothetical protein